MLDPMVERARQQEIFSRENNPTERRMLGVFLYHAGLLYRKIEPFADRCYEVIRDWFHRCKHLFELDYRDRQEVVVDETKIDVDGQTLYGWAAVDYDTRSIARRCLSRSIQP